MASPILISIQYSDVILILFSQSSSPIHIAMCCLQSIPGTELFTGHALAENLINEGFHLISKKLTDVENLDYKWEYFFNIKILENRESDIHAFMNCEASTLRVSKRGSPDPFYYGPVINFVETQANVDIGSIRKSIIDLL